MLKTMARYTIDKFREFLMGSGFFSWLNNIKNKWKEHSPQIITEPEQFLLIKRLEGYCGLYDGQPHSIIVENVEDCHVLFSEDNSNWSTTMPIFTNSGNKKVYVQVSRNKRVEQSEAKVEIIRRAIKLQSGSDEKRYDGTELSNSYISFSGDGFIEGEGIEAKTVGQINIVGNIKNDVEYFFLEGTNPENYQIDIETGVLSVLQNDEKISITLKANDLKCIYDGEEKVIRGLEDSSFEYNGNLFSVSGIEIYAKGKDAGKYETRKNGTKD